MCYGRGGTEPTVTDANLVLGRIPPHLLGGEVPLDLAAAAAGLEALGAKLGLELPAVAAGVLEISAWNQANALRQVTVQRGLDVRDFVLATFGGSGSLAVCRLLELLGLPAAVVPRDPGNLSAFGLLTVDVKNDEVQTAVARHADLEVAAVAATLAALTERAARSLDAEGFARTSQRYLRSADLRYFGQAFEVRVPVPDGPVDPPLTDATVAAFHDAHHRRYGYSFRDDPTQQVEWVNLRVTGVGPIRRPTLRPLTGFWIGRPQDPPASVPDPPASTPNGDLSTRRSIDVTICAQGTSSTGRRWWRSTARRCRSPGVPGPGRPLRQPARDPPRSPGRAAVTPVNGLDPVTLEIVEGTLAAVEREVETAIGRTARSPMIRDAHDFRAGIHDARLRKLTGRSYSALVHPVVRDFPLETMRPGDVFFHNDVYLSEGGIGHLPDLCVTVPVFSGDRVVAFVQAFGHHDDIGGAVPGSMPSHATSVFEEGLMVPRSGCGTPASPTGPR